MNKKVISFSLWGNNPKYTIGAIRNAELAATIYPDWICRFYVEKDVENSIISSLAKYEHVEIEIVRESKYGESYFWRFYAAADPNVEIVIFRDTDSRLNIREKAAVEQWIESDKQVHIMRDHPLHFMPIMAGMWGVKGQYLNNIRVLVDQYLSSDLHLDQNPSQNSSYGMDQHFLYTIYPFFKDRCFVHDEFFIGEPFPIPRINSRWVGQTFNVNEESIIPIDEILNRYLVLDSNPQDKEMQELVEQNKEKFALYSLEIAQQLLSLQEYPKAIASIREAIACSCSSRVRAELVRLFEHDQMNVVREPILPNEDIFTRDALNDEVRESSESVRTQVIDLGEESLSETSYFLKKRKKDRKNTSSGFGGKRPDKKSLKQQTLKISEEISDLFTIALNFHQQKQFSQALKTYQQILTIDPNHLDSLSNLGSVLKNLGRYDEAIACYQRVLELRPE